jgi:hypothetical protein
MDLSCLTQPLAIPGGNCISELEDGLASPDGFFLSAQDMRRFIDCAATAKDCTNVLTCVSRGHGPDYCAKFPGGSCDGDVRVLCAPSISDYAIIGSVDCADFGMHCTMAQGNPICTDGTDCEAFDAVCDGNRLAGCPDHDYLRGSIDCSAVFPGGVCDDSRGFATCALPGPACDQSGSKYLRCDDSKTLAYCFQGREWQFDCSFGGGSCATDSQGPGCVSNGTCDTSTHDRCTNNGLTMCADGQLQSIDCASIGLATCKPNGDNAVCAN